MKTLVPLAFVALLCSSTATAQWANVPVPRVPRTSDGNTVTVTLLPDTQRLDFICLENEKKTGGSK